MVRSNELDQERKRSCKRCAICKREIALVAKRAFYAGPIAFQMSVAAVSIIRIAACAKPQMLRWLAVARSPNVLAILFMGIACAAIAYLNARLLFVEFTLPTGDGASNDILVTAAKRFALLHGHYSRMSFYHPGPFYFQWMAVVEWLFVDVFHVFVSPSAAHHFSIAVLQILAFALYLRFWLLWSGSALISIAALLVTNAVAASIVGMNYVVSTWPAHFYLASALMVVTGFLGMAARGPSWLPLFIFGLAQLVHGHASFVGLAPIMMLTAAMAAWLGGRLPNDIWRPGNAIAYVKAHPMSFTLSAAIAVLFMLPILINTIVAWPGELPRYFRAPGHNSFIGAIRYVIAFIPLHGLWILIFLLPARKAIDARPRATDYRFMGISILAIAYVPAFIYALRGVDNLAFSYLLYWISPFIGAALITAILYFGAFISIPWLRLGIPTIAALVSLSAYRVWTPVDPDTRSTATAMTALAELRARAVAGKKIMIRIEGIGRADGVFYHVWPELVSILAAMNRDNANFLCVEPGSWHLLFHEQYRCGASDKASEIINVVPKDRSNSQRIVELATAAIIPTVAPSLGSGLKAGNPRDAGVVFSGEWSNAGTSGILSNAKNASLTFNTSLLPQRFAMSIRAGLSPGTGPPQQSARITDDEGRELAMLTNAVSPQPAITRIELGKSTSSNMMTIHFEITSSVGRRRSTGLLVEEIVFTEVASK
jgi:hypothetical protein